MRALLWMLTLACGLRAIELDLNEPPSLDELNEYEDDSSGLAPANQARACRLNLDLNTEPADTQFNQAISYARLAGTNGEQPLVWDNNNDDDIEQHQGALKRRKLHHDQGGVRNQSRNLFDSLWNKVRALPRYFDFDLFKKKFNRRYTATEAFLRRSIFVQKCMAILTSRISYRLGKKSYLESVNNFSDRTPEEFQLMFMAAPPLEWQSNQTNNNEAYREQMARRLKLIERANDENYRPELKSQASLEPSESSASLVQLTSSLANSELDKKQLELLLTELDRRGLKPNGADEALLTSAFIDELRELGIESNSCSDLDSIGGRLQSELPWPGTIKSADEEGQQNTDTLGEYKPPQLAPQEALDWSHHQCFHEIYDQGKNCGKCYVMASTALAEFYKCTEGGPKQRSIKRKFSKDYVLNCAPKFAPTLMGCAGGSPFDVLRFIAHAGIFNIRDWRQRRTSELQAACQSGQHLDEFATRCPLRSERTPIRHWGNTRVEMNPKLVAPSHWKEALLDGPLVASVQMPTEGVDSYAGGVHDGHGCATSNTWHAMLLTGFGTDERGRAYWRFRNSFGPNWGDRGHFNMAMDVPGACLLGAVRVYREPLDQ